MTAEDQPDEWNADVAAFVRGALPAPPCRVLDVGCGDGWLVRALAEVGYEAVGIDPDAPADDASLLRDRVEDLEAQQPFDAVVAVLSLHHIGDLDAAAAAMGRLLAPSGVLVCVEFAWDRLDDATAAWCVDHLPDDGRPGGGVLDIARTLRERRRRGEALEAAALIHEWADQHGFHTSARMLSALRNVAAEERLEWAPYLYPDLDVTAEEEQAALDEDRIAPLSLRFVGRAEATRAPRPVEDDASA